MRHRDEKYQRLHAEYRNTMESLAILLSLPTRFVEAHESTIKDRIREILSDNKDKSVVSTTENVTYYVFLFCRSDIICFFTVANRCIAR